MKKNRMWTVGLLTLCAFSLKAAEQDKNVEKEGKSTVINKIQAYIESQGINKTNPRWKTRLPKFPEVEFNDNKTYTWELKTNKGDISIKLRPDWAPNHVANFLYLTELGYFDGLSFHRVIQDFMAQGGCPLGTGTGNPGYKFDGEFTPDAHHDKPGLLSMANAGPGTDGAQFFITFKDTPWLDGKHTLFGEVVDGMDTLKKLEKCGSRSGATSEKLLIEKATIGVADQ